MIQMVTPRDVAAAQARGDVIIDVRNADEFASGHIAGAQLVPLFAVPLHMSSFSRRQPIYVVCESGARGQQASQYLDQHGYDVRNMQGGMSAWRSAGLPVTQERSASVIA